MITRQIKKMSWGDQYVTPEIKTLEIKSEGMLCLSFAAYGEANRAGKDLEEDNFWNF